MYQELASWENLYLAYKKASKGKRRYPEVADFEYCLEENLFCLQEELQGQIYNPGKYYSFYIHEPKRRLISAAPFRDRGFTMLCATSSNPSLSVVLLPILTPTGSAREPTAPWIAASNLPDAIVTCCSAICASFFPPLTMQF
jgi:hypothetical protein